MKKLKVAVIGCGRISAIYKNAFHDLKSECQIILAMDKVQKRAEQFAAEFPGCTASDMVQLEQFRDIMKQYQPDIVHILLPHHLHCAYAIAAMKSGVNVLTEKPVAITLDDANRMIAAQKESQKKLGVIFQNRYIDGVVRVRELIQSGALGKVKGAFSTLNWYRPASYYDCDWKGKWETEGGGVVIDQAIHSIDLVRYMTGMEAVKVQGHISRRILKTIEVEDEADAAITLENGAVYSFFACNYYTMSSPIRIEICCENATALLTLNEMQICWNDGHIEQIKPSENRVSTENAYWGSFHKKQIQECYSAVRHDTIMPWTAEDAKQTLAIVQGIYLSSKIHSEVNLSL